MNVIRLLTLTAAPTALFLAGPVSALAGGGPIPLDMQPQQNIITLSATVTHDVTPDAINMFVNCEVPEPGSRKDVRARLQALYEELEQTARPHLETNGLVRRSGPVSIYPSYPGVEPITSPSQIFTGNLGVFIKNIKAGSTLALSENIEDRGCSVSWDIRIDHSAKYARILKTELMEQLDEQRGVYEDWLEKSLTQMTGLSLITSTTPYYYEGRGDVGGYDPRTNKVTATTNATMTYKLN